MPPSQAARAGRCDPRRPGGPEIAATNRLGHRAHGLCGDGGQIGSAGTILIEIDLLQCQDVRIQLAHGVA